MDKKQNGTEKTEIMVFAERIKAQCETQLAEGAKVRIVETRRNNTPKLTGISITEGTSNVSPIIYLEPFYGQYVCGRDIKGITEEIISICREHTETQAWDVSYVVDYEECAPLIRAALINYEGNTKMLEDMPHRKLLDLAVIYYMETEIPKHSGMQGEIKITNSCMERWRVREDDLYEQSLQNMEREVLVMNLGEILKNTFPDMEWEEDIQQMYREMFVLTSKTMLYGAAMLLFTKELDSICEKMQSQQLVVIPSSVHEVILLSFTGGDPEGFTEKIREVNQEHLERIEVLSEHPYIYDSRTKELSIWHEN